MGEDMRKLKKRLKGVGGGVHLFSIGRMGVGQGRMRTMAEYLDQRREGVMDGEKETGKGEKEVDMGVSIIQRLLEVIQENERRKKGRDISPGGTNYSPIPRTPTQTPT
jgi:hypothetical protein